MRPSSDRSQAQRLIKAMRGPAKIKNHIQRGLEAFERSHINSDPAAVQDRLRQLVKAEGKTQEKFFDMCGVPHDTGKGWFRTKGRVPDSNSLIEIAKCTSVSLDWLLLGRGEMYYPPSKTIDAPSQLRNDAYRAIADDETELDENRRRARLVVLRDWDPGWLWNVVVHDLDELSEFWDEVEEVYDKIEQWTPAPNPPSPVADATPTPKGRNKRQQ